MAAAGMGPSLENFGEYGDCRSALHAWVAENPPVKSAASANSTTTVSAMRDEFMLEAHGADKKLQLAPWTKMAIKAAARRVRANANAPGTPFPLGAIQAPTESPPRGNGLGVIQSATREWPQSAA